MSYCTDNYRKKWNLQDPLYIEKVVNIVSQPINLPTYYSCIIIYRLAHVAQSLLATREVGQ